MSDKPSAAWYLAPIFLGIVGSTIMWYVLKDEDHPDSPKMVKKGWVIGIVLTLVSIAWIPVMLIPMMVFDVDQQMGDHMRLIPDEMEQIPEPMVQMVPAPGFEDVPEMIVESENNCDSSYPDVCIPPWPPDLNCGDVRYVNFKVLPDDPHGFDDDNNGIGCEG